MVSVGYKLFYSASKDPISQGTYLGIAAPPGWGHVPEKAHMGTYPSEGQTTGWCCYHKLLFLAQNGVPPLGMSLQI